MKKDDLQVDVIYHLKNGNEGLKICVLQSNRNNEARNRAMKESCQKVEMQQPGIFTDARVAYEAGYVLLDVESKKKVPAAEVDEYLVVVDGNTRFWAYRLAQVEEKTFTYHFQFKEYESPQAFMEAYRGMNRVNTPTTTADLALNAKFKIALTGTPVENSLRDLWSIMDFAAPGLVGIESEFVGKYKIKRNAEAADYEKVGNQIRTQLGLHFLRRLKKDLLSSLPAMDTKKICEEMPVEQEAEYQRVMADYLPGTNELATIQGLKTVSEHPYLNDDTILARSTDEIINASARLMVTMKILEEIKQRGEKVIVFVERRKLQTALKKIILEKFDLTVNVVNGDTPTGDKCHNSRQKLIDDFENTKGFNIIIMSPLAAGVGLNVVGANNVIHYSRLWNPAKESQATDRVYRIGQTKDVHVYYPMAIRAQGKCFDETLDYLLKRKQELAEAACYPSQKLDVTNDELVKELLTTEAMPSSDKKLY